jgi:hypothetical protein
MDSATLAQLVERLIRNHEVSGSTPEGGSNFSTAGFSRSGFFVDTGASNACRLIERC